MDRWAARQMWALTTNEHGLARPLVISLAKYVPTRAELSSLKLCRVQPDLSKGRKAAKITRADINCRSNGAKLRWSLKDAKADATTGVETTD